MLHLVAIPPHPIIMINYLLYYYFPQYYYHIVN